MHQLARTTFAIGSITFIFIGLLHTYVHLSELSGADLQIRFDQMGTLLLQGAEVAVWDLFQGTSLLMGFFSLALGCVLLCILLTTPRQRLPHWSICLTTCVMLVGILAIGALYLGRFQVIGGLIGVLLFALPIHAANSDQT